MENAEIIMTTLNGLPRTWVSFIQGICARKKLVKCSRLWEESSQEEDQTIDREEKMGSEDQDLTVQSKKTRSSHHKGKYSHQRNKFRNPRDNSKFICYTCDERGHFARDFPRNKSSSHKTKGNKRRNHAHATENDEPSNKRVKQESEDYSSDEEYVLIFSLIGTVTHGSND